MTLVLFSSCKKHGFGYIEGNVYEEGTNLPVVNASINLTRSHHYNSAFPFKSTTTDENGHFKIKYFNNYLGYQFYLGAYSDTEYSYYNEQIELRATKVNIFLSPLAYIKIRVKNNLTSDIDFSAIVGRDLSLDKRIKANLDTTFNEIKKANGNGSTPITWSYRTVPYIIYSTQFSDQVTINKKSDTVIYFIQIN